MTSRKRVFRLAIAVLVLVAGGVATEMALNACSDYEATVFVNTVHPDPGGIVAFADGDLGLLQPGFSRSYLVVAYRHLAGLGLDDAGRRGALDLWSERASIGPGARGEGPQSGSPGAKADAPVNTRIWDGNPDPWSKARKQVMGDPPQGGYAPSWDYEAPIITGEAYGKAAATLDARVKEHGPQDPWVKAWVTGQDLVFSRIRNKDLPLDDAADAPLWYKQDRAYQRAAALHYERHYPEAAHAFAAIGADKASPHQGLGIYLEASNLAKVHGSDYQTALHACEAGLKNPVAKDYWPALEALKDHLAFLRDPAGYIRALGTRLSTAKPGVDFMWALDNYTYAWDRLTNPEAPQAARIRLPDDALTAWIRAYQTGEGAIEGYLANPSLPWLVAAMTHAKADDKEAAGLMKDADQVRPGSPAYLTLQYQLTRLELEGGHKAEAARRIESFTGKSTSASFANAMLLLKRQVAPDFASFLKDLPMHPAGIERDGSASAPPLDDAARWSLRNEDTAVLQTRVPLDLLREAALDPGTPREAGLPRIAFEKALWLDRVDVLRALEPELPQEKALIDLMVQAKDKEERLFVLGLREGRIRQTWSYPSDDPNIPDQVTVLTKDQHAQAQAEQAAIKALGNPVVFNCQNVLSYAEKHPDDPRVPEALHQAVRLTYNVFDDTGATSKLSARCFQLLHRAYPKNEWTAKTKYHY